jgi:phytoene dehydrogenase-like protein
MSATALVVGAGIAGLAAATELGRNGITATVLEASGGVGGRIRTDAVDGFLLDRGFQIYLDAYPEGFRFLDLDALELQHFDPGAIIRSDDAFHRLGDPRRRPGDAWQSLRAPVGNWRDKARFAFLLQRLRARAPAGLLAGPDVPVREYWNELGFSPEFVSQFLQPFFTGIFLDPELHTSARMFRFVMGMFARGNAAVPRTGMEAIPRQLAAALPAGTLRLDTEVAAIAPRRVTAKSGEEFAADAVIVAVDGPRAARLLGLPDPGSRRVTSTYFAAPESPLSDRKIVLNGTGIGPINNVAVMSDIAPSYAPPGRALVVASSPVAAPATDVRSQLEEWFGDRVGGWEHLRTYAIEHALPAQAPPFRPGRDPFLEPGLYVAGDHRDTGSINGALASGRRAATAAISAVR